MAITTAFAQRLAAAVAACAALGLGLSGCSFSYHLGTPAPMKGDEVAQQISSTLGAQKGRPPEKVTCPDLKAEVGATITCQLTDSGKTYDVAVNTTSVDDGKIKFGIQVAATPVAVPPPTAFATPKAAVSPTAAPNVEALRGTDVATQVIAKWRQQNGRTPYPVTCPSLPGRVGAQIVCALTDQGRNYDIAVTTTSVSGTTVKFSMTSRPR